MFGNAYSTKLVISIAKIFGTFGSHLNFVTPTHEKLAFNFVDENLIFLPIISCGIRFPDDEDVGFR